MKAAALLLCAVVALVPAAAGQVVRLNQAGPVKPHLGLGTITVTATPALVSFTLTPAGIANASSGVTIQTTVSGLTLLSSMSLYGYFMSTNALTSTLGSNLPSAAVFGLCTSGSPTSYTAFTQSGPFATGSSLLIWQTSNLVSLGSGRTDVLSLRIDLTNYPQQPAGSYSGTLIFQAQAL